MKKALLIVATFFFIGAIFAQTDNNDVLSKMRTTSDGNSVYYYDKSSPDNSHSTTFYIYLVKQNSRPPVLKVRFQYYETTRAGIYAYNLKVARNYSFKVTPPTNMINKGSGNNYYYNSYCDLVVENKFLDFLKDLVRSENPKIEYLGTHNDLTLNITRKEINAISNVLEAYDALNN